MQMSADDLMFSIDQHQQNIWELINDIKLRQQAIYSISEKPVNQQTQFTLSQNTQHLQNFYKFSAPQQAQFKQQLGGVLQMSPQLQKFTESLKSSKSLDESKQVLELSDHLDENVQENNEVQEVSVHSSSTSDEHVQEQPVQEFSHHSSDILELSDHQSEKIAIEPPVDSYVNNQSQITTKLIQELQQEEVIEIPCSPMRKALDPEFVNISTVSEHIQVEQVPEKEVNNDFLNHLNGINIQKKKKIQETMHDQRKRQIKCMSFNLLNGQRQKEASQNWEQRFNAVISVILTHGPDIIGTQEAYHWQLDQIRNHLPLYGQYGSSRNGFYNEKADEFCAVLYKKDKFRVVQGETFFLSETPELVSKSWGSVFNRIATAVKFEILASGKQFWFFSTQLDFSSDEAVRCNQTHVLLERMQKLNAEGLPVVLSGDFHSPSFGPAHQKLTQDGHLRDAASKAREVGKMTESSVRGSDMQARKNRLYEGLFGKKTHQDWIFTDKDTEVLTFAVCTDKYDGVYPALHYPIVSDLEFK
ncbi:endonuclease/exonuclease/phosphatase_family protein [Hexamita inflata]|uniref:Endonuclease/exonuclease/phosphatase family protein n=1 Tax=Hexamita inflata TaxID=28002 RepID=A0AA86P8M7_9EUKA|nr:endonuclease/exonuclease/phosphatase family protein [Hexamita inflata]CAI9935165.1 endonuclease/exonuclease/phosphatase family protein [Hexamita inflata]